MPLTARCLLMHPSVGRAELCGRFRLYPRNGAWIRLPSISTWEDQSGRTLGKLRVFDE